MRALEDQVLRSCRIESVTRHANGALRSCVLRADCVLTGIPCRADEEVELFANGRFRAATLASDYCFDGLPCAAGSDIVFDGYGRLRLVRPSRCVLIAKIPCCASQYVFLYDRRRVWNVELAAPSILGGRLLPTGTRVTLDRLGALVEWRSEEPGSDLIQGMPCSQEFEVWFFPSGQVSMATLRAACTVNGRDYPALTTLYFRRNGAVRAVESAEMPPPGYRVRKRTYGTVPVIVV